MMKKVYPTIDIAKYVAALLVVAIHTYPLYELNPLANTYFLQTVCRLAVPFFFVSSGMLFFRQWGKDPIIWERKLRHYEYRLGLLYLVWTLIYIPYTLYDYFSQGFHWYGIVAYARDLLLNGSYYHLWFLPALMLGMFLVVKAMQYFSLTIVVKIALILYVLGYFINIFQPLWQVLPVVSFFFGFFTKVMVTSRNGLFFAPIFLLIGYFFAQGISLSFKRSIIGFALSFVLVILEVSLYQWLGLLHPLSSMYLSLIPAVFFLMACVMSYRPKHQLNTLRLRKESLVIYTSHILFAKVFLSLWPNAHLVVYFITLACAQALATFIATRRSPRWQYLV